MRVLGDPPCRGPDSVAPLAAAVGPAAGNRDRGGLLADRPDNPEHRRVDHGPVFGHLHRRDRRDRRPHRPRKGGDEGLRAPDRRLAARGPCPRRRRRHHVSDAGPDRTGPVGRLHHVAEHHECLERGLGLLGDDPPKVAPESATTTVGIVTSTGPPGTVVSRCGSSWRTWPRSKGSMGNQPPRSGCEACLPCLPSKLDRPQIPSVEPDPGRSKAGQRRPSPSSRDRLRPRNPSGGVGIALETRRPRRAWATPASACSPSGRRLRRRW